MSMEQLSHQLPFGGAHLKHNDAQRKARKVQGDKIKTLNPQEKTSAKVQRETKIHIEFY